MFLWVSNVIGILPFAKEPTRDVNTPLAMAAVVIATAHISGMRVKGFKRYVLDYCDPPIVIKGIKIPNIFIAPLNIVGECGKALSLPFRLYGNIFGGAVIIIVLSHLIMFIGLPLLLQVFFGFFVGTIQAFVFTMLALTYTAVAIAEAEE